jgi:hypothetical protein
VRFQMWLGSESKMAAGRRCCATAGRRAVKGGSQNQRVKHRQTLRSDVSAHDKSTYWGHGNSHCFAYHATETSSSLHIAYEELFSASAF